jgi:hypothetical protein
MTILKQMQRFNKVNKLIKAESTGNPADFAKKLFVSRRQMFSNLGNMGHQLSITRKMKPIFMYLILIWS